VNDPLTLGLKFGFLAILYLFLIWVVRSSFRDMAKKGREPQHEAMSSPQDGAHSAQGFNPRLVVNAAEGHRPGTAFDIGGGVTLGRSPRSDVCVEDPYASSMHARLFRRGEFVYVEDMGSTNGTFLNGEAVRSPKRLGTRDVIRIGDTEYEYQE
jgi:pSer/pThr/pTyr-binding forkhead associated (FHA) protein